MKPQREQVGLPGEVGQGIMWVGKGEGRSGSAW